MSGCVGHSSSVFQLEEGAAANRGRFFFDRKGE